MEQVNGVLARYGTPILTRLIVAVGQTLLGLKFASSQNVVSIETECTCITCWRKTVEVLEGDGEPVDGVIVLCT